MPAAPDLSRSTEIAAGVRPSAGGIRTEARLLFALAGGSEGAQLTGLIGRGIDWERFERFAVVEGATAVVAHRLRKRAPGAVPPHEAERLDRLGRIADLRLTFLEGRLLRAIDALQQAGIQPVLLKGAGLAVTAYKHGFADRPMADVDLLVAPTQAAEAQRIVSRLGWLHRTDVPQDRPYDNHQHLPPLEDEDGVGVGLEIHTSLFASEHPFGLDAVDVRARARQAHFHGRAVLVPDRYDQIVHACLHFAWSHELRFGAWKTFLDLDVLARRGELDWDEVVRQARAVRGASCCFWAMRLAKELAAVPVPDAVLATLRPKMPRALERRLVRHFAMQLIRGETACPSDSLTRGLWRLGVRPHASGHGESLPWSATAGWAQNATTAVAQTAVVGRFSKAWRLVSYLAALAAPIFVN